jgi:hypothetical protein
MSLQRGFPGERGRGNMDGLPATRSLAPVDQCNDLRTRGRL